MTTNSKQLLMAIILPLVLFFVQPVVIGFDHSHSLFTQVLEKNVNSGTVNYRELQKDRQIFDEYITQLESVGGVNFASWSREQKLAYWVNAYNAFTIEVILDNYPIKPSKGLKAKLYPKNSIRQIPGVWDKIKFNAGGMLLTLNHMEHEILRKEFDEPRIHFAIVCASVGCPELWNHAYEANNIDQQLEAAAKRFVRDRAKVRVDLAGGALYLSKILQWFKEDFTTFTGETKYGKYNGVVSFCYQYFPRTVQRQLKSSKLDLEWLDYDWSLNE